jgi:hypothetical protein
MQTTKLPELYSRKNSAKLLDITINQFNYLVNRVGVEPVMRIGDKHAAVLYSKEQIKELKLALRLQSFKLSEETIAKIIDMAKSTDYNKPIWIITFEDVVDDPIVCFDDDLLEITGELKETNTAISIKKVNIPFN